MGRIEADDICLFGQCRINKNATRALNSAASKAQYEENLAENDYQTTGGRNAVRTLEGFRGKRERRERNIVNYASRACPDCPWVG